VPQSFDQIPDRKLSNKRGSLVMSNPAPGVFASRATGQLELEHARLFMDFGDALLATPGSKIGIHHWYDMLGYDSECRRVIVGWTMKIIRDFEGVHVGLRSRLVKMGVTIANVALGGVVTMHEDRAEFERFFGQLVEERLRPG
jgi:hypothetical protein